MANTKTYEVTTSSVFVRSKPSLIASTLVTLTKGTKIEVISISNLWAYFKYNGKDAYVLSSTLKIVTTPLPVATGSLAIKYIDVDSKLSTSSPAIYENLQLKSYTYSAKTIPNYTVYGDNTKTVTLTQANPNQTITFTYKKILGKVTIKYIDVDTNTEISTSDSFDNLELTSYTYTAKEIAGYTISSANVKSVILTQDTSNQTIIFTYKKNVTYGSVTLQYINTDTKESIKISEANSQLTLGSYTYNAPVISKYALVGDQSITVTLTDAKPNSTIVFEYKKIVGSITIKYIDKNTKTDISPATVFTNLDLALYSYNALSISGYSISGDTSASVLLTESLYDRTITFEYSKTLGRVAIQYVHIATGKEITTSELFTDLELKEYSYSAKSIPGYTLVGDRTKKVTLTDMAPVQTISFEYKLTEVTDPIYVIELSKYNISNDNTNATNTTKGINSALVDAKAKGYKRIQLPAGHYSIDTYVKNPIVLSDGTNKWTHNRQGIAMQSDMELILDGALLEMVPCEDPYYSILTISNCTNSKVTGGTILGDRVTHDYGLRINQSGNDLELGSFDTTTGLPIDNVTQVRTKNFIYNFNGSPLPNEFYLSVLEKTTKNTVDGGVRYIHCYDKDGKYLGLTTGGNGFISKAILQPNTAKIKISFKDEKRLDGVYFLTKRLLYFSYEFGSGMTVASSDNIQINSLTIKDCIGDCVCTIAPPLKVKVNNLSFINCTLENSRRQGISFVATGENYLIKDCNIGKINGTDPQTGIDFEHYDYVKNVIIDSCHFYDNRKWDIINYNGQDIEIKNCIFEGGIGSTYGWNMDIHDNEFIYKDTLNNPKLFTGVAFTTTTNKTDADNAYFKIYNNSFTGYINAGRTSNLTLSSFTDNKLYNTNISIYSSINTGNIFENSNARYCTPLVSNQIFKNSICGIDVDKFDTVIDNCKFEDSQFMPRKQTTISNCQIVNKTKPFGDTSAWWSLQRKTIFENCTITTEYTKAISFLSGYNANSLFKNCILNLSRYLFCLNYGGIEFEDSKLIFNNLNTATTIVDFDKLGYGNETNYWKFTNCYFESTLPLRINTKNIFNCTTKGPITANIQ